MSLYITIMSLDSHEKSQNSKQNEMIMGQNPSTLVKEQKYMYKKIKIANFVIWQKQKKKMRMKFNIMSVCAYTSEY